MAETTGGERPKFLTSLLAEIESFDAVFSPPCEKGAADKEVGTCSPYLIKMFSLARFYEREAEQSKLDHTYSDTHDQNDCDRHYIRYVEMKEKYDVLMEMFWACCRAESNSWLGKIGVRKGWLIVTSPSDDHLSIIKLLSSLRPE